MGFRVNPRSVLPLDCLRKRGSGFYRFRGFSRGGAAHKKQKRRGVWMVAMPEDGISVTSHQSLVTRGS